ncbi:MAG: DUF2939 domain-containing protein [Deltaproteobacteria bacterium]|nr:DUF2939 domain-containing protein [Deltaproteobacteria bacterium]
MRRLWIIALLIVVIIGGCLYASPYITLYRIKTATDQQDTQKLSQHIDFPTLRLNLKEQIGSTIKKNLSDKNKNGNPLAAFTMAIADILVNKTIDAFVTPEGIATLMKGDKPEVGKPNKPKPSEKDNKKLLGSAKMNYRSLNEFEIRVPNDTGNETTFILSRAGLKWKLTNIIIPMEN